MTTESAILDGKDAGHLPSDTETSNLKSHEDDHLVTPKIEGLWSTTGRIGRVRYCNRLTVPTLIVNAISAVLMYYSLTATPADAETAATALTISQLILAIPLTIFALIQGKRRLNDQGRSGWWQLLFLIPLAGLVPTIMMTFVRGTQGDNRFGAEPSPLTSNEMTLFWFLTALSVVACVALTSLTL